MTLADFAGLIPKGPKPPPVSFWNPRQQGTRPSSDAVFELQVAPKLGAEHWAAALVLIDASFN